MASPISSFGGSSVSVQVQNAFTKPVTDRCAELTQIIHSTSTKELRNILPLLVENIFGFGSESGWCLDQISKPYHHYEFKKLRQFLAPEGPLLTLINSLQTDVYLTYQFPFKCLPAPSRHMMLDEGVIPNFFVNKIQFPSYGQQVVALSAFEFYMFHFAYMLVNPDWHKNTAQWINHSDFLYPTLVEDYLTYFLPLNTKTLPAVPYVSSPVRSPVMHPNVTSGGSPASNVSTYPKLRFGLGLLKSSFISATKQHTQSMPAPDQSETETWRSETLLQESFMPSSNQVRIVRIVVKHLHYFMNSATPDLLISPYQQRTQSPLDEFKKMVVPQIMQKKLYAFLRHSFDRWPLDSSFRLILETWLSYVQPWRYVDPGHLNSSREKEVMYNRVDGRWYPFIMDNLLFYVVLFQEFMPRLFRMDLNSALSAYMLFRVIKVFGTPNLSDMLRKAEHEMIGPVCHAPRMASPYYESGPARVPPSLQDLGSSYLSPSNTSPGTNLHLQLTDLEGPTFQFSPLFGENVNNGIQDVISMAQKAKTSIQNLQHVSQPRKMGLMSWFDFSSWFDDDVSRMYGDLSKHDVKRILSHLDFSIRNLSLLFQIPVQDHQITSDSDRSLQCETLNQTILSESNTPDHIETENGPQLTPLGRYQLMNGLKKFDISYQGDPELLLINSYENATLVRLLYRVSSFINTQYAPEISHIYHRRGLVGMIAKAYLAPPLSPTDVLRSPLTAKNRDCLEQPGLRLRWFAQYQVLMYIGILYVICSLAMGLGPFGFSVLILLVMLVYGIIKGYFVSKRTTQQS